MQQRAREMGLLIIYTVMSGTENSVHSLPGCTHLPTLNMPTSIQIPYFHLPAACPILPTTS